jgi:uncharacterized protein
MAVTADSPTLPRSELHETRALAEELGAKHLIVATDEIGNESFVANPLDRCYYCKRELFSHLRMVANHQGFKHVVYGATADDAGDYRPGLRAAAEAGAMAPLLEAGFTKQDVRELSEELGLRTSRKPAMACLASRFPYGSRITEERLTQVERAEDLLRRQLGFSQIRVRHHGTIARIEIPPGDFHRLVAETTRQWIKAELGALGYQYVTLDLQGFRSGSMNEAIGEPALGTSL